MDPIVRPRNYAPERVFVTKWDVEINNNRIKDKSRRRDRFTKYFTHEFEHFEPQTHPQPIITHAMIQAVQKYHATETKRKLDDAIYDPCKRSRIYYDSPI